MKWYQFKEQAAGEKRLLLSWYLYGIFGKKILQIIAFVVTLVTFCSSRDLKTFTKNNLSAIYHYTANKKAKPTLLNCFKNTLNYSLSLVDRIEAFARNFDSGKIVFDTPEDKDRLQKLLQQKKGIFFICNHIGNIEALRCLIASKEMPQNPHVNIFLDREHCKTFNNFLKHIEKPTNVSLFPVEEIGVETAVELEEKLANGEIVFIAGDRLSQNKTDTSFNTIIMGKNTKLPSGTFKLAQLMNAETFFISALKSSKDRYKVFIQNFEFNKNISKQENLQHLEKSFTDFMEKMINKAPTQFYHFYDFFE